MIRYALICADCDHEFEAWFASSSAYDALAEQNQVTCADCGSARVSKQIMAPSVRTSERRGGEPDPEQFVKEFARKAREHVAENFDYVGDSFADEARAMYYGEQDERPIWGETTAEESDALQEEGVPALPLPPAFAPKKPRRKQQLN